MILIHGGVTAKRVGSSFSTLERPTRTRRAQGEDTISSRPIIFWMVFTLDTYWRIVAARHIVDPARQKLSSLAEDQGRLRSRLKPRATLSTDLESRSDMTVLIRPQASGSDP